MSHTHSRPRRWRRVLAAATAGLTGLSLAAVTGAPAIAEPPRVAPTAAAAVPTLLWRPCRDGFECASVRVPLDHDDPSGRKIRLSVVRLPAADPDQRIGALFLNPGGPGGSGVDIARGLGPVLPLELRGRFDIVGFDPRGILRSTPLRCYRTEEASYRHLPQEPFPITRRQETRQIQLFRKFAAACDKRGGRILEHMSTADVARDMDLMRQAMGDEQLNYLGFSYGSMLGQNYANLFPDRARAVVIDGVLDPVAWSTGRGNGRRVPVTARLRSAEGARDTLRAFFRLCDRAGAECAFSGGARQRFVALSRQLKRTPINFGGGDRFTYRDLVSVALGGLYSSFDYPYLARFLAGIERASGAGAGRAPSPKAAAAAVEEGLAGLRTRLGLDQEPYPNFVEGFPGVLCSDSTNPRSYARWRTAADDAERTQGRFARLWLWNGGPCGAWPKRAGQDRYTGPWTAPTAEPVLVVGNSFDPATPLSGAQAAAGLLPNSRLLTYAGWGHTAFFSGNYCVDRAVTDYLVTTEPPDAGTVCQPAGSPFGPVAARTAAERRAFTQVIAATLPASVRQALAPRS